MKKPPVPVAFEGRAQLLDWSACCAPAKYYEDVVPLHTYTLTYRTPLCQFNGQHVSLYETYGPPPTPTPNPTPV
jgi:hypothetical protein